VTTPHKNWESTPKSPANGNGVAAEFPVLRLMREIRDYLSSDALDDLIRPRPDAGLLSV